MNKPFNLAVRACSLAACLIPIHGHAADAARPLAELGDQLHELGITPKLAFWNLSLYNPDTGSRTRQYGNSGNVFVGFDMRNENDGTFHFLHSFFVLDRGTGQPTDNRWPGSVGSYFGGAPLHNDLSSGYLSRLSYSKSFLDDSVTLEGGRLNARQFFNIANCLSVVACTDPILDFSTGVLPFPYATWGLYGKWQFSDTHYVHMGAFESNIARYLNKEHGYHFGTSDSSISWLAGIGDTERYDQVQYPLDYEINMFWNTAEQTNLLTGSSHNGTGGILARVRQTLWRAPEESATNPTPRALEGFANWSYSADPTQPYRAQAEAGVTLRNPFGRASDLINGKVSWIRLSDQEVELERRARLTAGGKDQQGHQNVWRAEMNGHFALTKYLAVEPSVQYIWRPESVYRREVPELNQDGYVIGLQLMFDVGGWLGL